MSHAYEMRPRRAFPLGSRAFWRSRFLALALGAVLVAPAAWAVEVPWLYEVTVPVADQSAAARLDAGSQALAQLLTRLTGLTSVPRNEAVSRALNAPDLYFNQFGFVREPEDGQDTLKLRLQFMPQAVLDLIRDANLPVWPSNRPSVLAWIVVDDGTIRRILAADAEHPLVEALERRSRERGVPLRLPLLDLTDQLTVEPAAVWGRLTQILEPASARYGADALLIGRLQLSPDMQWRAEWEFQADGQARQLSQQAREPAALGRAAADMIADELSARYAVLDRGVHRLDLSVSQVGRPVDYAELLRYLNGLEFVQEVAISAVSGDRLQVSLLTAADTGQLLELFSLDRRLLPDRSQVTAGPTLPLIWQGR